MPGVLHPVRVVEVQIPEHGPVGECSHLGTGAGKGADDPRRQRGARGKAEATGDFAGFGGISTQGAADGVYDSDLGGLDGGVGKALVREGCGIAAEGLKGAVHGCCLLIIGTVPRPALAESKILVVIGDVNLQAVCVCGTTLQ